MYLIIRKASLETEDFSVLAFSFKRNDAEIKLARLKTEDGYIYLIREEEGGEDEKND